MFLQTKKGVKRKADTTTPTAAVTPPLPAPPPTVAPPAYKHAPASVVGGYEQTTPASIGGSRRESTRQVSQVAGLVLSCSWLRVILFFHNFVSLVCLRTMTRRTNNDC